VYRAVENGGPPADPDYPTFADGHWENVLAEAIGRSSRERRWIDVEVDE
jgi:predicted dehydrogenase